VCSSDLAAKQSLLLFVSFEILLLLMTYIAETHR